MSVPISSKKIIVQITHPTYAGTLTFGPAFEKNFLREVFRMQMEIEQLGQAEGAGMEQVCFAPVTAANADKDLTKCTVQSAFGYFGNSISTFESNYTSRGFEMNYLNVLDECIT